MVRGLGFGLALVCRVWGVRFRVQRESWGLWLSLLKVIRGLGFSGS